MPALLRNPFTTPFAAVFRTEVLLNSKRAAPYVLIVLFTAHAILWWGWSVGATYGWAVNGDFNIVRNLSGFSFLLGLPIFNAVIMGDPVTRDFRLGVDPLLFSKPIDRVSYILGKFFGNFFVLVCCQSAFVITMVVLQFAPLSWVVLQPPRFVVFFKHLFFIVILSHLLLAAVYFAVGTLTRNTKIVYGLAVAFYPLYISWMVLIVTKLPTWRMFLDPMMPINAALPADKWTDAAFVNQIVVTYSPHMLLNRGLIVIAAGIVLFVAAYRFSIEKRTGPVDFSRLNLTIPTETIHYDREVLDEFRPVTISETSRQEAATLVRIPEVSLVNEGFLATLRKLFVGVEIELRLLRSERSLVFLIPLTALLSFLALPFSSDTPSISYASSSANGILLFLLGAICFHSGESVVRERELRVESLLWTTPTPDSVFVLTKMIVVLALASFLVAICVVTTILTQILRGQTPIDFGAYIKIYGLILVPSLIFMTAACVALTMLFREKYVTYAVVIAISGGLLYLYTQGYNHWLYNPVLYGLWTPSDLQDSAMVRRLVTLRGYTLGLAFLFVLIAHLFFSRPRSKKKPS